MHDANSFDICTVRGYAPAQVIRSSRCPCHKSNFRSMLQSLRYSRSECASYRIAISERDVPGSHTYYRHMCALYRSALTVGQ